MQSSTIRQLASDSFLIQMFSLAIQRMAAADDSINCTIVHFMSFMVLTTSACNNKTEIMIRKLQ